MTFVLTSHDSVSRTQTCVVALGLILLFVSLDNQELSGQDGLNAHMDNSENVSVAV